VERKIWGVSLDRSECEILYKIAIGGQKESRGAAQREVVMFGPRIQEDKARVLGLGRLLWGGGGDHGDGV